MAKDKDRNVRQETSDQPDQKDKRSGRHSKTPKKKNVKARLLVMAIAVVLLVSLVAVVLNMGLFGSKPIPADIMVTPDYLKSKTQSILICGIDNDEGRPGAAWNTDMIMVANFDMENDTAALLQIPRDMYVGESLVYTGKINALYYYGYKEGTDSKISEPGIACLMETINKQMKLPTDHYVMITMEGFRRAIDILGGIDITLDKDIEMDDGIVFKAGVVHLDGIMADKFVRYRGYAMADIERINVQRYFMAALMNKLLNTSTMDLVKVAREVYEYLETDLTVQELLQLAKEAKELSLESISVVRVPGEGVKEYGLYGLDVFSVHKKELADLLNQYMRSHMEPVPETELEVIQIEKTWTGNNDPGSSLAEYGSDGSGTDGGE